MRDGEDALMLFNGRFAHAVRKLPKPGDFRVQDDYGGTVHPHEPSALQIEFAQRAMAACQPTQRPHSLAPFPSEVYVMLEQSNILGFGRAMVEMLK